MRVRSCPSLTRGPLLQLEMLTEAVDTASENPAKFNLTIEEIQSRRKWLDTTRRQVQGVKDTIKTMTATGPYIPSGSDRMAAANDAYLGSEMQKQEQIMRNQDQMLGDLERGVDNVTAIANTIHEQLEQDVSARFECSFTVCVWSNCVARAQDRLLTSLDKDMDSTHSRLKATSKKVQEIIRKSGTTSQVGMPFSCGSMILYVDE